MRRKTKMRSKRRVSRKSNSRRRSRKSSRRSRRSRKSRGGGSLKKVRHKGGADSQTKLWMTKIIANFKEVVEKAKEGSVDVEATETVHKWIHYKMSKLPWKKNGPRRHLGSGPGLVAEMWNSLTLDENGVPTADQRLNYNPTSAWNYFSSGGDERRWGHKVELQEELLGNINEILRDLIQWGCIECPEFV